MELKNLHEILVFLGREPEPEIFSAGGLKDGVYEKELVELYEAVTEYEEVDLKDNVRIDNYLKENVTKDVFNFERLGEGDKLVYNLTKAAYSDSKAAGYACFVLGRIYDKRHGFYKGTDVKRSESIAVYYYGKALEKGYLTTESKKAYAEACTRMGWFDTALYWYPEEDPLCFIVRAFLKHRIRYCEERGVTFPKTENNIVCIEKTEEAKAFEEAFVKPVVYRKDFEKKMEDLEKSQPPLADNLYWRLDSAEGKIISKKRWARRLVWIFFVVLSVIFLFAVDGNDAVSSQSAGVALGLYAVFSIIASFYIKHFTKRKYSKMYAKKKRALYDEYKIASLLKQNDAISFYCSLQVEGKFENKNAIAYKLHKLLTSKVNFVDIPEVYCNVYAEEDCEVEGYESGVSILDDYDAFSDVLMKFYDKAPYILLWSGDALALTYYDLDDSDEFEFSQYFSDMFHEAMDADKKNAKALLAELKILNGAVENKHRPRVYESAPSSASSSSEKVSFGIDYDKLQRGLNLWTHGTYSTNQEAFDELHRRGEIDDYTYRKATTYGWQLSDLDND